jgi:hypothetical protein
LANPLRRGKISKKIEREISMKKIFVLLIFFLFLFSLTSPVLAEDPSPGSPSMKEIVQDVVWIRPLGIIRIALEAMAFGISYPVTRPLKKVEEASDFLLKDPYSFTFERPAGEM